MDDYGMVRSTVKPEPKTIDEYSVWVNTDISEIQIDIEGETHTEYEFHQVRYSKNEYIEMIDDKNSDLESQLTDTQLALCEVYELMI